VSQSITKGAIYLGISQLLFLISGYAIHIGLGRLLGPELYGVYAVVISLITVINLILITGIPQTVSKFVSETPDLARSILKTSGKFQLYLSLLIFAVYFISASFVAEMLRDNSLVDLIRLSSVMIPLYAFFSLYGGYLNGLRDYRNQSVVSIIYYISKIGFVFGFVLLGYSVFGAVLGFAISPIVGLFVAIVVAGVPVKTIQYTNYRRIIRFAAPIIFLSIALNFSTSIDLLALKAIVRDAQEVGYYSAASMISKVPLTLLGALNMALFPAISSVTYLNDVEKTREYIHESFRYVVIFLVPATVFISFTSTEFVSLLYSQKYTAAGEPLRIIIIGILFFSIFAYLLNIVVASGKATVAMSFSIFQLMFSVTLNLIMIPLYGMIGAALAVTLASLTSMIILLVYVIHKFGSVLPWITLSKVLVSTLFATLIFSIRLGNILILIQYLIAFILYLIILKMTGEIKERDIARLKRLIFPKNNSNLSRDEHG
jgi:stage V sporulation protein B